MDQIEEISADLVHVKSEQCIVIRTRDAKVVLTNPVSHFKLLFCWDSFQFYRIYILKLCNSIFTFVCTMN